VRSAPLFGDIVSMLNMELFMSYKLTIEEGTGRATYRLCGDWTDSIDPQMNQIQTVPISSNSSVNIIVDGVDSWNGGFVCFLFALRKQCFEVNADISMSGLPSGAERLLTIAESVPERDGAASEEQSTPIVEQIGALTISVYEDLKSAVEFTGDVTLGTCDFFTGKARFAWKDFILFMRECGPSALPIITLITFLVGLILAFVGAIQLRLFGAQIFVADLVGIGMVRELGAIMAAIVMAGRTGAAYAAQLGTMQVNEEVDALETMGISTIDFLVLPRMFALVVIMPLLCVYADLMGVLGGMFVGVFMLDISPVLYYEQSINAIRIQDFIIGVFMSGVFGVLVSGAGCLRGMQCGRSSSAVGKATTSAVVSGIVCIIISTALITVICDFLGV